MLNLFECPVLGEVEVLLWERKGLSNVFHWGRLVEDLRYVIFIGNDCYTVLLIQGWCCVV